MYLCKFDSASRRTDTLLACEYTDEQKQEFIEQGYIEITEEDWNYYVGNNGQGANGTGYIRGADGKPTDAPAYVPTKEEKLAQLDAQYQSDVEELTKYFGEASLKGDTETQAELQAELVEVNATYVAERKAIEEE